MNHSHSIMVAYGHNGLRSALNVAEALESIADVQLRSYDELQRPLVSEPDVALCLVIDDETLEKAHQVQVRLEDVPTFVIDGLGELKIELNGYAGRLSSSPDQVLNAIRQHLVSHPPNHLRPSPQREPKRQSRRISSPFDYALARAAGDAQTPQAVLIAAARQLSLGPSSRSSRSVSAHGREECFPAYLCRASNLRGAEDLLGENAPPLWRLFA